MNQRPVVYVVDDDLEVREALRLTLELMDLEVVCAESGPEFLDRYQPAAASCLIVDLRMSGMSGIELLEVMADQGIRLPTIMISGHGDVPAAVRAMKEGVIDFLEKPYRIDALRESVRSAIQIRQESQADELRQSEIRQRLARLTAVERQVFDLTILGLPDKAIAAQAEVSLRTVQLRRARLMRKLEASSRVELVRISQSAAGARTPASHPGTSPH